MEEGLASTLGTRVQIEPRERGGRIWIDYFSHEELLALSIAIRRAGEQKTHKGMFDKLKEEDIETLNAVPNTERYIKPITEITHLNKIETIHEVHPSVLAVSPSLPIPTTSEAVEIDEYKTVSIMNGEDTLAGVLPSEALSSIELSQASSLVTEVEHLGHIETIHEVSPSILVPSEETTVQTTSEALEVDEYKTTELAVDDRSIDEIKNDEQNEDLYNLSKFAL
jgi:hypothetical protein